MKKILCVASVLVAVAIALSFISAPTNKKEDYEIPLQTYWCVEFKKAGTEIWSNLGCAHNVITDAGKNHVEGLLGGTITSNMHTKYIAVGNGTAPTSSSTTLNNEQTDCGLARKLGDYYDLGVGNWEVNTTFTYTCDTTRTINTTASFNQASGGTMFAGGTITPVTLTTNGDQVRIRHIYTIS